MFYLIEISTGDAQIAGRAVYAYNTEKEAIASFHTKLGQAMKSPLFESELVMVIDENGAVCKHEKFVK